VFATLGSFYQQYATLLRELRTLPDPCDTMHKNKNNNGSNPRPSQMLNTPLEGNNSYCSLCFVVLCTVLVVSYCLFK